MTNQERLQEREREQAKLLEIKKRIPRERYQWELKASPAERHRRRAEEVANPELKKLHLEQAEQQEEQERLFAEQVLALEEQVARNQEEDEDRLFQLALQQGPTRLTRIGWKLSDTRIATIATVKKILAPIAGAAVGGAKVFWTLSNIGTFIFLTWYCYHLGLGWHYFANLVLLIVLVIIGLIAWEHDKKGRLLVLTLTTLIVVSSTAFWKAFTPKSGYLGVQTRNGQVVATIDSGGWLMSSPRISDQMIWYFKGGQWVHRPGLTDSNKRFIPKTKVNGQAGDLTIVVNTQLKPEVTTNPPLGKTPDLYRTDMQMQLTNLVRELRAKGEKGEKVDLADYHRWLKLAANDAYNVASVSLNFTPDPVPQQPPSITLQ